MSLNKIPSSVLSSSIAGVRILGILLRCTFVVQITFFAICSIAGDLCIFNNTVQVCASGGVDAAAQTGSRITGNLATEHIQYKLVEIAT